MAEKKQYTDLERVLNRVNKHFIALPPNTTCHSNKILKLILEKIVAEMKNQDDLFGAMFRTIFYGGSYYDGLKVGKAEEYDIDLLLQIPKFSQPVLTTSNVPGFVHLNLNNLKKTLQQKEFEHTHRNLGTLFDKNGYLNTDNVLNWAKSLLTRTMETFPKSEGKYVLETHKGRFQIGTSSSGPALTLKVTGAHNFVMDIDLVMCFVFGSKLWPGNGFRENPVAKTKPEFFIVPKAPKTLENQPKERYWRLSFQEQERALMDGKKTLKPTIKLLKKMRDKLQQKAISSYYIKTALLWILKEEEDDSFWQCQLSYVFMNVLKKYQQFIANGKIPYYWNQNNNLLGDIQKTTLNDFSNRLTNVINNIEGNLNDPTKIVEYLLSESEKQKFFRSINN